MRRLPIIAALLLVSAGARAQDDDAPPRVRVEGASVHAAARFLAHVHEVGAWVAAPVGPPLTLETDGTPERAFSVLASASGLSVRRRAMRTGTVFWVGEEHRLLRAEGANVRGLSGGRRIDLDLQGAPATELASLLAAVSRVSVRGVPLGALTVTQRGARSSRALETLARLADARIARRGREVSMRLGSFPDWPRRASCEPPAGPPVELACAPTERLRLVGLAPGRALVAVVGDASRQAAIVEEGDRIGAERWRVAGVDDDGLRLAAGDAERVLRFAETE